MVRHLGVWGASSSSQYSNSFNDNERSCCRDKYQRRQRRREVVTFEVWMTTEAGGRRSLSEAAPPWISVRLDIGGWGKCIT